MISTPFYMCVIVQQNVHPPPKKNPVLLFLENRLFPHVIGISIPHVI